MAPKSKINPKRRNADHSASPSMTPSTQRSRTLRTSSFSTSVGEISTDTEALATTEEIPVTATEENEMSIKAEHDVGIKVEAMEDGTAAAPIELCEDPVERYDQVIYDGGDMIAIVGPLETRYLVSSHILKQASKVWKSQITKDTKEIFFVHDPPNIMANVLYLAHYRADKVPEKPTFSSLVGFANICDKYGLVSLVRSHVQHWALEYKNKLKEPGYEEWLYVAWVLGLTDDCERLARHLQETITTNAHHHCLTDSGRRLDDDTVRMPPDIVGCLLKTRAQTIQRMQELYAKQTKAILDNNSTSMDLSNIIENGAMISAGNMLGFEYFNSDTTRIHGSVAQVIASLNPFKTGYFRHPSFSAATWNKIPGCMPTLRQGLDDIFIKMSSVITKEHTEHMQEQSKP